jgi:hypothetical protein
MYLPTYVKLSTNYRRRTVVEMMIVGSTGIGYAVVGVLQGLKGEYSNMAIWLGYSIAQVGLFLNLK